MKIQISYIKAEEKGAAAIATALLKRYPGAEIRHTQNHPPRQHIYITVKEPKDTT